MSRPVGTKSSEGRVRRWSWVPVVCSITWLITLFVLLVTWGAQGRPHYVSQDGSIPYISDIGADVLKPFFIVGCVITAIFLVFTLVAERWLRHKGHLTHDRKTRQKVLAVLAIIGSIIGGLGLILLSIFDTKRHTKLHRLFLGIFVLGVALSAIFTVAEYFSLSRHNRRNSKLRWSAYLKAIIAGILIVLAIAFAICLSASGTASTEAGAVLEWVIAFGFVLYPWTFWMDLRRARAQGWDDQFNRDNPEMQPEMGNVPSAPRRTWDSGAPTVV